jgi:hypothetical protein
MKARSSVNLLGACGALVALGLGCAERSGVSKPSEDTTGGADAGDGAGRPRAPAPMTTPPAAGADAGRPPSASPDAPGAGGSRDGAPPPPPPAADGGSSDRPVAADGRPASGDAAGAVQRLLYAASAGSVGSPGTIDVFDINQNHRLLRRIRAPVYGATDKGPAGLAAHVGSARLYFTEYISDSLTAIDLMTERVLWTKKNADCKHFDRLTVTNDGKAIFVPCHDNGRVWVVNPSGDTIKYIPFPDRPHNTFTGESGRYVYLAASRNPVMLLADPVTYEVTKMVGPFNGLGVRPFSVNKSETLVFTNIVALLGFQVGDVATGKLLHEVKQTPPAERTANPGARAPRHGADPVYYTLSHGIAVRPPDSKEVWFVDDEWGYLYVYDITAMPPRHVANVPLFTKITDPWTNTAARWVQFSLDGRYVYPANGLVVDAEARRLLPERITGSEKIVEIQWRGGVPIAATGQMGGVYTR